MHRVISFTVLAALILLPLPALAGETWTNVSLIDSACQLKVKDAPDTHTRECALQCVGSGYGILTADGTYLTFDKAGNDKALAMLRASRKNDHLRVNVSGERKGNTIAVTFLEAQ